MTLENKRKPSKPATEKRTKDDLRHLFDLWKIDLFSIIREQEEFTRGGVIKGNGATVRYLRKTGWQTVTCVSADNYAENVRQIFLFLDRIRIAEKKGMAYQGLSSSREIVKSSADPNQEAQQNLEEAYDLLGVKNDAPFDLVERMYKTLAAYYHPDNKQTGDEAMSKRVNQALDLIKKARGEK